MPANSSFFAETKIPHQKNYGGVVFPAVLSPSAVDSHKPSVLTAAVKEQKPWLESLLHRHGAILFRGFDSLDTASDFNDVVEAFGYEEQPYVGGAGLRTNVVGRVFTANESPPDQKIPFHHEMAHAPVYPAKLFFFCEVEPASGGETPIVLSHVVYDRMKEKYHDFVEKLEKHRVIYTRASGEEDDPSSPIGRGWKSIFSTKDKSVAEERAAKLNMKLEWTEDGVKTIIGPIPAIKFDETRQRKIWFNSIVVSAYTGWGDSRNDPKKAVTFEDGSLLPEYIMYDCLKIMEEESIAIPWEKGDILLIDNLAVLHSRKPFTPPRRILASLCKKPKDGKTDIWLNQGVHRSTPFPAGVENSSESQDSESSSGQSSDDLKLKYPELYGIQIENLQKRIVAEDSPNWNVSPPKTCVILEPPDGRLLKDLSGNCLPLKTTAVRNQQDNLSSVKRKEYPGHHGITAKIELQSIIGTLDLAETTPMMKERMSSFRMGKHPGENTLKKELWTKFEAASTHGICFNGSLLQNTTKKGFLDRLEDSSDA